MSDELDKRDLMMQILLAQVKNKHKEVSGKLKEEHERLGRE